MNNIACPYLYLHPYEYYDHTTYSKYSRWKSSEIVQQFLYIKVSRQNAKSIWNRFFKERK